MEAVTLDEKLTQLESFFTRLNERGMNGKAGAVWPLIIRRWDEILRGTETHYNYAYPRSFFRNMKFEYQIHMPYEKKSDRVTIIKFLLDRLMAGSIDIHMYHFGLFLIYHGEHSYTQEEDFEEKAIGKKRVAYEMTLPRSEFKDNDTFISSIWSSLIERRETDIGEYRRNPIFNQLRILFTSEQFGNFSGMHYYDADWVEPISGKADLECKRWVGEKDPMTPEPKKKGMIEGSIILGHEGSSGLRHFVSGKPINAGSYIEVKFGDGWIPGRYEWSFEKDSPIRVHSSRDELIHIREGHLVRVRD